MNDRQQSLTRVLLRPAFQAAAVAIVAFAVYRRTLAPTVMWYDMGEFATAAVTLGIAHNTGYPLFMLLGKLFSYLPLGDPAYRINLMSAFFAALTVSLTYLTIHKLTRQRGTALCGSLVMAFSSVLWGNATWAEAYSLNAFFTILLLLLLLEWRDGQEERLLLLAMLLFGLGLGNHRLLLGMGLPLAYATLFRFGERFDRPELLCLGKMAAAFLLGFSVHLYLPIRAAMDPPVRWADASDLGVFLEMITTGSANPEAFYNPFGDLLSLAHWGTILTVYPSYELTAPGFLLSIVGGALLFRKDRGFFIATGLVLVFTLFFVSTYGIHDIFNYFLPIYQVLILWLSYAVGEAVLWLGQGFQIDHELAFLRPRTRGALVLTFFALVPLHQLRANYRVLDRSDHRDPLAYATLIETIVGEDSIVLTDFWSWTPLLYQQVVRGRIPNVRVIPAYSNPDQSIVELLQDLEGAGATVYVAHRFEDRPRNTVGPYVLNLVAPYAIRGLPTDTNPAPQFKDLLVPRGGIFRVSRSSSGMTVEAVPANKKGVDARFGENLELLAADLQPSRLRVGGVFSLELYWRLDQPIDRDLWVDVLFTDSSGNLAVREGIPIWQMSHWVGSGAFPTSRWQAGRIYRERYWGVVPSGVAGGDYQVRLSVFEGGIREGRMSIEGLGVSGDGGLPILDISLAPD